jgi:hypothetical protein
MFHDMANPTEKEIIRWAYGSFYAPMEDWDLIISDVIYAPLLIRLISDPACLSRSYLIRALYVLTGDAVRSNFQRGPLDVLREAIGLARNSTCDGLLAWAVRSERLIRHPAEFDYDQWCDGGLARTTLSQSAPD